MDARNLSWRMVVCAWLALFTVPSVGLGCRSLETPPDLAAAVGPSEADLTAALPHETAAEIAAPRPAESPAPPVPVVLTESRWTPTSADTDAGDVQEFVWEYAALEQLVAQNQRPAAFFEEFLDDDRPVVVANAAIMLARSGSAVVDRCLVESIRSPTLGLPQRRAAIEALARLDTATAATALVELLDDLSNPTSEHYSMELHADLLRALAIHLEAGRSPYFAAALNDADGAVRVAGLDAYRLSHDESLPEAVIDLLNDPEPRVRAAALECLAAHHHPRTMEFAQAALTDFHLDVQLTGVRTLGSWGGEEARASVQRLAVNDVDLIRAAAIAALADAGDDVSVFAATKDPAWQVRRSVARSLARFPTSRATVIARQLLADQRPEVRRSVLGSIDRWPLDQAGPLLFTALAESPYATRKQAALQLTRRWPPADRYSVDAPTERRQQQLADLQLAWDAAMGARVPATPPADAQRGLEIAPLTFAAGAAAPTADPVADALKQLAADDVPTRRAAARAVANLAAERALDVECLHQIVDYGMAETDAEVWRELLRAIRADRSDTAAELAYIGSSHAVAEVRRLSCGYLGAHSNPRHTRVLTALLEDPNAAVVRAAIEALASPGMITDPAPLEKLLTAEDRLLRVAAARSLATNGFASGATALERLARDPNLDVRRDAVAAMGQLGNMAFVDTIVALLDDDLSIRLAGVTSLAQIVGHDVNSAPDQQPLPLAEQVQGWKRWWQGHRGAQTTEKPVAKDRG